MIRNASGQYSSVNDDDEWKFGSKDSKSSVLTFKPQFIIVPGRMVRIQALGPKDCGAEARIDLAMPVPWEFLTSEMWYCTNCCRNPLVSAGTQGDKGSSHSLEYDYNGKVVPRNRGEPYSTR